MTRFLIAMMMLAGGAALLPAQDRGSLEPAGWEDDRPMAKPAPLPASTHGDGAWGMDFTLQSPAHLPPLEVRYTDSSRTAFEVLARDYHLVGDLRPPFALTDPGTGETWLEIDVVDGDGKVWSTRHARANARINLFRRGPYYCEIRVLDITVGDEDGNIAPIRGDLALHCWPTHLHATLTWRVKEGEFDVHSTPLHGVNDEIRFGTVRPDEPRSNWFPIIAATPPPPGAALQTLEAAAPLRWDERRGCLVVGTFNPGSFEPHFYEYPNFHERARLRIANDDTERLLYVMHETSEGARGNVEGGVVLDKDGRPLPIVVQISKNFAGEDEEPFFNPGDPAFSETYFPLHLAPREVVEVESLHLYQNWGRKPVKQWSSLGAWMDYFHSSTGVTETTCYVPFKFGGLDGISIADLRAMSQDFWKGQPQHDNIAGHYFFKHRAAGEKADVHLEYRGTEYRSTGPNWYDVGLSHLSADGKVEVTVDAFETPQRDELRSFFRLRIVPREDLVIENAPENLKLVAVTSGVQRLKYKMLATSGSPDMELNFNTTGHAARGRALEGPPWFAGVYGDRKGQNGVVITGWRAPFSPAASVAMGPAGETTFFITAAEETVTLEAGKPVEIEGFLLPWGDRRTAEPLRREAARHASPSLQVQVGRKLADWPPTVLAENNAARFTFAGGHERVPLLVDGLDDWRDLALERLAEGQWVPVRHHLLTPHDGGQVRALDGGQFRAVFLPYSTGELETYRVRQVAPTRGPMLAVAPFAPQGEAFRQARLALPGGGAPIVLDFPARLSVNAPWAADPKVSGVANGGWQESEGGSWWFEESRGAIKVGGRITPMEGEAELEFWIANNGPDPVLAEGQLGWRPEFALDPGEAFVQRGDAWVPLADGPAHQGEDDLVLARRGSTWVGVWWETDLNTATMLDDAGQAPKARREREFDAGRRYYCRGKVVFAEASSREEAAKRLRLGL